MSNREFQIVLLGATGFTGRLTAQWLAQTQPGLKWAIAGRNEAKLLTLRGELAQQDPNGDARAQGGIDVATVQKWVNYWFSYSIDLFGSEISSNAADFFSQFFSGGNAAPWEQEGAQEQPQREPQRGAEQ